MNGDHTRIDAPPDPFMGISRVKNKKTKRYDVYMTTPFQPLSARNAFKMNLVEKVDDGYDSRRSRGPIAKAKKKVKRYTA